MSTIILVTGGVGFVGRAIVLAIREQHPNWAVMGFDINAASEEEPGVTYTIGDLTDIEDVKSVVQRIRPTAIIHTAGIVPELAGRYSRKLEQRIFDVNVGGTRNVIEAAKLAGVRALVYTGSCTAVTDDMRFQYRKSFPVIHLSFQ